MSPAQIGGRCGGNRQDRPAAHERSLPKREGRLHSAIGHRCSDTVQRLHRNIILVLIVFYYNTLLEIVYKPTGILCFGSGSPTSGSAIEAYAAGPFLDQRPVAPLRPAAGRRDSPVSRPEPGPAR